jgi:hypothetical protein
MLFSLLLVFSLQLFDYDTTKEIKNGDLVFVHQSCGPMCDAIIDVTKYKYVPYSHVGIIHINNQDTLVLEANSNGVVATNWKDFIGKYNFVDIGRSVLINEEMSVKAITFIYTQMGKPYDYYFMPDNDRYYCSELIYDAFKYANNNQPIFMLNPMSFKDIKSGNVNDAWKNHFQKMGVEIPEGVLGCNPGEMSMENHMIIYRYDKN